MAAVVKVQTLAGEAKRLVEALPENCSELLASDGAGAFEAANAFILGLDLEEADPTRYVCSACNTHIFT